MSSESLDVILTGLKYPIWDNSLEAPLNFPEWDSYLKMMLYNPVWEIFDRSIMDSFLPPKPRNSDGKLRDAETLGTIVRERRKELGLTQAQLAGACRCSIRFISELERGLAGGNIKQVIQVCRALGIDLFARVRGR